MSEACVLAVDPGRGKCGLAVVCASGAVLEQRIVPRTDLVSAAVNTVQRHSPAAVVIGNRTGSKEARTELEAALKRALVVVEEHETTLRSRERYYRDHPRRGLARLLPEGLFTPPVPLDDYAAVIMAERYWAERCGGDAETRGRGDAETWGRGDAGTRRHGVNE